MRREQQTHKSNSGPARLRLDTTILNGGVGAAGFVRHLVEENGRAGVAPVAHKHPMLEVFGGQEHRVCRVSLPCQVGLVQAHAHLDAMRPDSNNDIHAPGVVCRWAGSDRVPKASRAACQTNTSEGPSLCPSECSRRQMEKVTRPKQAVHAAQMFDCPPSFRRVIPLARCRNTQGKQRRSWAVPPEAPPFEIGSHAPSVRSNRCRLSFHMSPLHGRHSLQSP